MIHPLLYVCVCTGFWVWFYQYLCDRNKWPAEWNCRILAAIHAFLLTTLCLFCAYIVGPWPFDHPGGETTILQELILSLSLGYFLFDLTWCLTHKTEGVIMLVHHVASIMSILYCVYYRESGTEMIAAIGGAEITNPLLQLRWFLRELGFKYHGFVMTLVEYTFMFSFLLVRGIVGSIFLYSVIRHPRPHPFIKLGGFSIYVISVLFAYMIIHYMWRKRVRGYFIQMKGLFKTSKEIQSETNKSKIVNNNMAPECNDKEIIQDS